MKYQYLWPLIITGLVLTACSGREDSNVEAAIDNAPGAESPRLVVMDADLQQLKDDFNANAGRVRLVFLNGPTCGICLRGMADLNDEYIAASQSDDRLVTFVVHVPTMGAKEHHAVDSMPLLDGPRVHHYWEESGIIGQHYQEVMEVDMYVWDFWAIYGPDAEWQGLLPPVPDYYEHQLGVTRGQFRSFPKERVLDAARFARNTTAYLELVDSTRFSGKVDFDHSSQDSLADGTVIPHVGQPRNVAVRQHIIGRGGYRNLKRVQSIEARGRIEAGGTSQPLVVVAKRPNELRRIVGDGESATIAEIDIDGSVRVPRGQFRGLPADFESLLLQAFEFDGPFVDWSDKGHEVDMLGMQKFGKVLAWQLALVQSGGRRWHLYIDSHTGDLVRASLLADNGAPQYLIDQGQFRETSGFRFPHRISYQDSDGELLATETIEEIRVDVAPFELDSDTMTH